jgi:hypothetical protein
MLCALGEWGWWLGVGEAYFLHAGLDPTFVACLADFAHACAQPAESFCQCRDRIFLEIVQRGRCAWFFFFLPVVGFAAKAAIFAALVGRDAVGSIGVFGAHFRKVGLVLDFLRRHGVGAERGGGRAHVVAACLAQRGLRSTSSGAASTVQGRIGSSIFFLGYPLGQVALVKLPAFDLAAQPFFPFVTGFRVVALLYRRGLECAAVLGVGGVGVEEVLERLVSACCHARELSALEGIHGYAADERDMHAETAVNSGARQTHEDAELGGGL